MIKSLELFGRRLKEARAIKGMTQAELAAKVGGGVTSGIISHYESARRPPRLDQVQEIAEILDVDVAWLVGDSNFMHKYENVERLMEALYERGYITRGQDIDIEKIQNILEAIDIIKKAKI